MPFDLYCPPALASLKEFLSERLCALRSAALLLGGAQAARRFDRLASALLDALCLTHRLRRELDWLMSLLTLERVDVYDADEAACFATIDPASPAVEEICLVTDALQEHLMALQPCQV